MSPAHPEPKPGPDATRFSRIQECEFWKSMHQDFVSGAAQTGHTALDVGCGPGLTSGLLSDRGWRATGVDHRDDMVSAAQRRHPAATFVTADVYALRDVVPGPFDLVTASNLLFYLSDALLALVEMAAVAVPGGTVAMLNPAPSLSTERAEHLARQWELSGWDTEVLWTWARLRELNGVFDATEGAELFARAGMRDIKTVPIGPENIGLAVVGSAPVPTPDQR